MFGLGAQIHHLGGSFALHFGASVDSIFHDYFAWRKALIAQCSPYPHLLTLRKLLSSTSWLSGVAAVRQLQPQSDHRCPASSARAGEVLGPVLCSIRKILSQRRISLLSSVFFPAPPVLPQSLSPPCVARSAPLCFYSRSRCSPIDTNYNMIFSL